MSAPMPDSLLRSLIHKEASRVDREVGQPDGTTLRELFSRPLIEATTAELTTLWRQLQDTNWNELDRFLRGLE